MSQIQRINRREFLSTAAAVTTGITTNGLVEISAPHAPDLTRPHFTSGAGNTIPFARRELFGTGGTRVFKGPQLNEIAFPLGGIGTGTVSLGGRGNLRDWEIFNRPNKGGVLPFSFTTLWAREAGKVPKTKVVEAPLSPPFRGAHGISRESGEGLPRFRAARFLGAYPLARIEFTDASMPVEVSLDAFTPFIPLNTDDSSLPVAILRYTLKSRSRVTVTAALAFTLENPIGYDGIARIPTKRSSQFGKNLNEFVERGGVRGLSFTTTKYAQDHPRFGSMALVAIAPETGYLLRWSGGEWWDDFHQWWDEFAMTGEFAHPGTATESADGQTDIATLAPRVQIQPGESQEITFVLAWHFPVRENYWNSDEKYRGKRFRNDYAERFPDAWGVADYAVRNLERLERETRLFHECFFQSSLPAPVLDAASSQASIIRTNTCMLIEGRKFFGFEGCNDNGGCCPMNCTHVWNYEQSLANLFPDLERSMRQTDFKNNLRPDGAMAFRTLIPLGDELWKHPPAADGQMGCVMKVYREWQLMGDTEWLRSLWPEVKRALEYAWVSWDADRDGVMEGEQHNTYDIEFYGPNSMMGTLYLGALRAGERMARALGEEASAEGYRDLAEHGAKKLDALLFNGEFYIQKYNESEHAKYQFGEGCLSDQLLGQWFATVVNLGHVLPQEHVRKTLSSIYRHNFRNEFMDFPNPQRIYALNDEAGLLLCSWPKGKRPALPFVYSDEVWTGIEYQVAAHLIYEGMVEEGLAIVRAVRERYDGLRRNPWNEVECGSHYARAMSSWSLVLALSGFYYSGPERRIEFAPRVNAAAFRSFFSTGSGWGVLSQALTEGSLDARVAVRYGSLELSEIRLQPDKTSKSWHARATMGTTRLELKSEMQEDRVVVRFADKVFLRAGDTLRVTLAPPLKK